MNLFIFFFYNITNFFLLVHSKSKISLFYFDYFCFYVFFLPVYSKDCYQNTYSYLIVWAVAIPILKLFSLVLFLSQWNSEFSTQKVLKHILPTHIPLSFPPSFHFSVPRHIFSWAFFIPPLCVRFHAASHAWKSHLPSSLRQLTIIGHITIQNLFIFIFFWVFCY